MHELTGRTVWEHIRALSSGEYSAEELTNAYLHRIGEKEPELGAFLTVLPAQALAAARAVDRRRASGEKLPERMRDHQLKGNYHGHRECHIEPDWLLLYRINDGQLTLTATRTGSHAELFGL